MSDTRQEELEGRIVGLMREAFRLLAKAGAADAFARAFRLRAELTDRIYARTPVENRDMAIGQNMICYELVDGAEAALAELEADAKASSGGTRRVPPPAP